jgi:hypothetical protein
MSSKQFPTSTEASSDGANDYKNEVKKRLAAYVVGAKDASGLLIKQIFTRGDEYVVYAVEGDDISSALRVYIDTFDEEDQKGLLNNFDGVREGVNRFRSVIAKAGNPYSCMHRAAHAISVAIRGDAETAKKIIDHVISEIETEYKDRIICKFWYLLGSILPIGTLSVLSTVVFFARNEWFIKENAEFFRVLYGATFAGYGGFISISLKLNDIQFDKGITAWQTMASAGQRILYSLLFGAFTYVVISSELILGFVTKCKIPLYGILSFCLVAGFSEKFIPNILAKFENTK